MSNRNLVWLLWDHKTKKATLADRLPDILSTSTQLVANGELTIQDSHPMPPRLYIGDRAVGELHAFIEPGGKLKAVLKVREPNKAGFTTRFINMRLWINAITELGSIINIDRLLGRHFFKEPGVYPITRILLAKYGIRPRYNLYRFRFSESDTLRHIFVRLSKEDTLEKYRDASLHYNGQTITIIRN